MKRRARERPRAAQVSAHRLMGKQPRRATTTSGGVKAHWAGGSAFGAPLKTRGGEPTTGTYKFRVDSFMRLGRDWNFTGKAHGGGREGWHAVCTLANSEMPCGCFAIRE